MHICIVTSDRIFDSSHGGEGKFSISLGKWLKDRVDVVSLIGSKFSSVDAIILSKNKKEITVKDSMNSDKVVYPPYVFYMLSRVFMTFLWILKIFQINNRFPISIIHVQNTGYSGFAAILAGILLRVPVVVTSHGIRHKTLEEIINGKLKKILLWIEFNIDRFVLSHSKGIIVVNKGIKNYFENFIDPRKIRLIYSPIRVKDYEFSPIDRLNIRSELGLNHDDIVLGFIGRLSPEKNLKNLLTAVRKSEGKNRQLTIVLVGKGPLESELKNYVKQNQMNVLFLGTRTDVNRILSALDIFILPSFREGLSIALLEAMANGKAIICSNIDANRELIADKREGLIIDPYDSNSIEYAISLLVSNEQFRLQLGKNARSAVNNYDQSVIFPRILEYYANNLKK